jgi:pilus assembly protein CpaE
MQVLPVHGQALDTRLPVVPRREFVYPLAIGLAIRNNALWSEVTTTLRDLPIRVVFDHPEIENREGLLNRIEHGAPDVVLVEFTSQMESLGPLVEAIKATRPAPLVMAVQASPELAGVVTALRAGIYEFLYPPLAEKLLQAFERAQHTVHHKPSGKVIGFLSSKGGCGATTIACHTAAAIGKYAAQQEKRALLIDLDLNTGMVRFLMRTDTPYSVLDAASNMQKLDLGYWNALTTNVSPGLEVIAAPTDLVSKHQLNLNQVQHVLSFARCYYDWTLVDLGRGLGLLTTSVLDVIDELYLVTTAEVPALHLTKKIVDVLFASDFPKNKLRLVANRTPRIAHTRCQELEDLLGLPLFAHLPNDYSNLFQSYSECKLLPEGGPLARELHSLARRIMGLESESAKRGLSLPEWLTGPFVSRPRAAE